MLSAKNMSKSYGDGANVLTDVSLDLAPGTITTLVGPSGSGKSTLLRAISLLDPPDSGTISISGRTYAFAGKGEDVWSDFGAPPWPEVTVVFQQLFLWPHLTLRQNIELPIRKRLSSSGKAEVDELLRQLGMSAFADRYPNQVSLGQRQLAAIARALALRPKYMLLDEITSALDVEYVSLILGQLSRLREAGIALLLITHLIGFAQKSANQVLFMDNGRIVESGGPEILTRPRTDRMRDFLSLVIAAS